MQQIISFINIHPIATLNAALYTLKVYTWRAAFFSTLAARGAAHYLSVAAKHIAATLESAGEYALAFLKENLHTPFLKPAKAINTFLSNLAEEGWISQENNPYAYNKSRPETRNEKHIKKAADESTASTMTVAFVYIAITATLTLAALAISKHIARKNKQRDENDLDAALNRTNTSNPDKYDNCYVYNGGYLHQEIEEDLLQEKQDSKEEPSSEVLAQNATCAKSPEAAAHRA